MRMEISPGREGTKIIKNIKHETVIAMDDLWKNSQGRI